MAGGTNDFSIQISDAAENAVILLNSQIGSSLPQSTEPQNLGDRDPSFSTSSKPPLNNLIQRKSQTSSPSSKPLRATPPTDDSEPTSKRKELLVSPGPNKEEETQKEGMKSWEKFIISMETTAFACVMGFFIASMTTDRLKNSMIWGLEIWKWCLLILAILCGRLTAYLITNVLMSLIWKLWLDERVLYFAHGVKKSVLFFIWLALVTLAWGLLFNHGDKRTVTRGLAGCLIGATLWLLKTLLVKLIGSVHATKLFSKIKEAIRYRKVVRALSAMEMRNTNSEMQKQEKDSAETMRELMDAIRGKRLFPISYIRFDIGEGKHTVENITDEAGAKIASDEIFTKLADTDGYMDFKKLLNFVDDEKVIQHFEGVAEDKQNTAGVEQNNTEQEKQIKKSVFRNWVVDIYKDHDSLNNTLQHSKTAIDELNMIASVIVLIVVAVVWLLFMEVLSTKLLLFMSSQLLLVAFMFGNTVKKVFEAVIFVFVVHAFDVGDRCVIDGLQMVVDEMNILTTTFLRYDGEKIYYPNSILALKPISNLYRSPPMSECVEFAISLRTSMEIINDLQDNIKRYLESNPRRWRAEHSLQFKEIEDVNKMKVALFVNHTINFHYFAKRAKRRSELVLQMKQIFEELKIEYNLLPQQVNLSYTASAPSAPPIPVRRS
ncbi:mechanosensitive ion channel protein 10 [Hevea brasiliensis]|uniref:mechanosensitive ion channel protein 10 n=1 Tax=Hevea brasiliensis TaxID=3981 RepID=UPI0025DB8AAA|nr:mechanosensitive ion channel protein 10 [Hevea brasiliensis]